MLRGFDALSGFLLKRVKNPDFVRNLHGVDDAKGISTVRKGNFKDAGTETFERFGYIRFAVLCRDRQSCQADGLRLNGELFERLACGPDP